MIMVFFLRRVSAITFAVALVSVVSLMFFFGQGVNAQSSFACIDSDNTPDYYGLGPEQVSKMNDSSKNIKGTINASDFNGNLHNESDVCEDSNKVREHCCDRGLYFGYLILDCPNGCQDGACVAEPPVEELVAKQKFTVYAGVEVYYKNSVFELTGEASDPETGLSESLDMRWSLVSGPKGGKVVFSQAKCSVPNFAAYCKTTISANKDGVYKIRLKATNPKKVSSYDDFALVWDTTAPVLKEVKRIPIIGNDPNPTITFSSTAINAVKPVFNRFGDIFYGGACVGHGASAKQGNNVIELEKLADGTYDDCIILVKDLADNFSNALKISKFTIDTQPPAPPIMNEPEENIIDPSYTLSGAKEVGTSVWLGNKEVIKHSSATSWKYKVKLNSEDNNFSVFTEDEAGNNSEKIVLNVELQKPICASWTYGAWGKCDDNQQIRKILSAWPSKCAGGKSVVSKDCKAEKNKPLCESYNYSIWSKCVNNSQTRIVESTFPADCSGGVQPIKSRECGKSACDFVYYTTWSACDKTTGQRTRQIESTLPTVCVVENPWLTKDCNACESYNYSMWSACVNNTQFRTIESTFPSDCSGGAQPLLSRECGKEFCDFVYYTTWSKCDKTTGQRTRQIESTVPTVCVPENPWLSKDCDPCESYNYSAWSACDANGVQHRTLETDPTVAPTFPADCYGGAQPVYTRACPPCDSWIFSAWSTCANGQQTRTIMPGTSLPLNCWGGSPALSQSCV